MLALGVAYAMRDNLDIGPRPRGLDNLLERDGGARGRVELGDVVRLCDREFVAIQLRQRRGKAEELLHANRKICPIEQPAAPGGQGLHPAGGADDDAAAVSENSGHVLNGGLRSGEVDDRIDAGQRGGGESGGIAILIDVQRAHPVAALKGDVGDQAAGLSLA